jgi:hypothetical protein
LRNKENKVKIKQKLNEEKQYQFSTLSPSTIAFPLVELHLSIHDSIAFPTSLGRWWSIETKTNSKKIETIK